MEALERSPRSARHDARVILVMGVSGSGKSTIGRLLAADLGWDYLEGDDYHGPENVAKMARGEALDDQDRGPWLERLVELIGTRLADRRPAVLACSALKQSYRERLLVDPEQMEIVYLQGAFELIQQRLRDRPDHFMGPGLLYSQFASLEPPTGVIPVAIDRSPQAIVAEIRRRLAARP